MKIISKITQSGIGYILLVILLHVAGILCLWSAAPSHPELWGIGMLAYTLGMRHAFDIDHIAAIDNTVRKLVQQKSNPTGVGFFFSLGHSSVVFLMVVLLSISVQWMQKAMPQLQMIGGIVGTVVSGLFLIIIGFINLIILLQLSSYYIKFRRGEHSGDEFVRLIEKRGFFTRLMKPLFRFITRSWHVYPLGFLFGLGFDTASEIALLALSAGTAKSTISIFGILSLPLLFAAGMSLMDTLDGMFMAKAYRWAFSTPLRKIYYNLTVTSVAVAAALLVGLFELFQVISTKLGWKGAIWDWLQNVSLQNLGYGLVILFIVAWAVSVGIWKYKKIGLAEKRLSS